MGLSGYPIGSIYDEATLSLGFMVRSMNFDLKVATQILTFSITSKPKAIEIQIASAANESGSVQTTLSTAPVERTRLNPASSAGAVPIET